MGRRRVSKSSEVRGEEAGAGEGPRQAGNGDGAEAQGQGEERRNAAGAAWNGGVIEVAKM